MLKRSVLFLSLVFCSGYLSAASWMDEADQNIVTIRTRINMLTTNVATYTILASRYDFANPGSASGTGWPHLNVLSGKPSALNIDSIIVNTDLAAASTASVKVGIVNYVDASTGSITWVWGRERLYNVSGFDIGWSDTFYPGFIKCKVNPSSNSTQIGSTPFVASDDVTIKSTVFQTDVVLPTPLTNSDGSIISTAPATGDIVVYCNKPGTGTNATFIIQMQYHATR